MLQKIVIGLLLPATAGLMFAQAPVITTGGTVNAASNAAGQPVAPGSLVSIYGSNFAAGLAAASTVPFSTSLNGTSVSINGIAAPLDFISQGQIKAQVPFGVLPPGVNGSVNVVVTFNSNPSAAQPVVINQAAPGIFGDPNVTPIYAVAYFGIFTDPRYGQLAWPPNTVAGVTTANAHPGDVLTVLATGLGPVTPVEADGSAPLYDSNPQSHSTVATPTVLIGNPPTQVPAIVLFSGLSPQFPGVYQLNIQMPQGPPAGNAIPLYIQAGGLTSPPVYIGVSVP